MAMSSQELSIIESIRTITRFELDRAFDNLDSHSQEAWYRVLESLEALVEVDGD